MVNIKTILLFLPLCFIVISCNDEISGHSGFGMEPVYSTIDQLDEIGNIEVQDIRSGGPIYLRGDFFFMTENKKGIHVFDIADDQQEEALTFISIPAITDFTIDGNYLYADSWRDLVTIDISDIYNVQFLNRQKDLIDPILYPLFYNGPFECIDESKGAVVGWEGADLKNVFCHTTN